MNRRRLASARSLAGGLGTVFSREIVTGGLDYFDYQMRVAREELLPWLRARMRLDGAKVADFGCHAGGTIAVLRESEVDAALGVEINAAVVEASPLVQDECFRIVVGDLTALDDAAASFDLVLLHDVLEHVVDCDSVLDIVRRSLRPGGRAFVSFPPYWAAFGGHQFLASGPARHVPYVHYLPDSVFRRLIRPSDNEYMSGSDSLDDIISVRRTRLSLDRAERAFARAGLVPVDRELFVLRPEFKIRYGLPIMAAGALGRVRGVREVLVNGAFYLLGARAG